MYSSSLFGMIPRVSETTVSEDTWFPEIPGSGDWFPQTLGSGNPCFRRLFVSGDRGVPETFFFSKQPQTSGNSLLGGGGAPPPLRRLLSYCSFRQSKQNTCLNLCDMFIKIDGKIQQILHFFLNDTLEIYRINDIQCHTKSIIKYVQIIRCSS